MKVGTKYRCIIVPIAYKGFYAVGKIFVIKEHKGPNRDYTQTTCLCPCARCQKDGIGIPIKDFKECFTLVEPETLASSLLGYLKGYTSAQEVNKMLEHLT